MINNFIINGTTFEVSSELNNSIIINSHPQSYEVVFGNAQKTFLDTDVLIIDKNVQKIYNIEHSKMIIIEATEDNKSINTVLDICEKLLNFGFDKGHNLIVMGGGIIQDIGAYTAKTFKKWRHTAKNLPYVTLHQNEILKRAGKNPADYGL